MIRIYKDSNKHHTYYIREGSRVASFDKKKKTIECNDGVRVELFLKRHFVNRLQAGTREYSLALQKYEDLLGDLPLPNRYGFRVLKEAPLCKMEEQAKALRINPHWYSA